MEVLPAGTVTFLVSDIEASSRRWEDDAQEMRAALRAHDAIVMDVCAATGGATVKNLGDGWWIAFADATNAATAAVAVQRRLQSDPWPHGERLKVRIGLHTAHVTPSDGEYFGPAVNRAARVVDIANGDQIVCSAAAAGLLDSVAVENVGPHELRGIGVETVYLLTDPSITTDPRPLRRPALPDNLPRIHTSFVGRKVDLDRVLQFLGADHSVVTLLGPGGVGKTRLAVEAGGDLREHFRGGIRFCDLTSVGQEDALVAIADAVGARRQPGMEMLESIVDFVAGRHLLLILDNCEHVLPVARAVVGALSQVDGINVLATSRAPLGVRGEQLCPVDPLDTSTSAVQLFTERAAERDPAFELTPAVADAVTELVARLDGIPLAIELAAARIRVMSPAELLNRIDDRFRLLRGDGTDPRQTLRNTVEWSYRLLDPAQATLFRRLSLFSGPFCLAAAEAVCSDPENAGDGASGLVAEDVAEVLTHLVDHSMVVTVMHKDRRHFRLLDTIKTFASDELGRSDDPVGLRRRHADYYRTLAAAEGERMWSAAEPDVWRVLGLEWANLRTAVDTYRDAGNIAAAADTVLSLSWFATMAMRIELLKWGEELLALDDGSDPIRRAGLCGAAALAHYLTADDRATEIANAGLAIDPDDRHGLCRAALAAVFLNNLMAPEDSERLTASWLAGEPVGTANRLWAHGFRTFHLTSQMFSPDAAQHAAETVGIARATSSVTAGGVATWATGLVEALDDIGQAVETWEDGLEWPRSVGAPHMVEHLLLGLILHFNARRGDLHDVLRRCHETITLAVSQHYMAGTSHLFGVVAIGLIRAGDPDNAARLVGAMISNHHEPRSNARRALEEAFGPDLDAALERGRGLTISEAAQVALDALDAALERTAEDLS